MRSSRAPAALFSAFFFAFFFVLSGCARAPGAISPTPAAVSPTPALTASPTPTAAPTPTPTPQPTQPPHTLDYAEGFYAIELTDAIKARITGKSYPADGDAAIRYDDLRYLGVLYVDFDGASHEGELIVHELVAAEVLEIFHELYLAGYPFTSIRLVDEFGEFADDELSMQANNTSAFNYRLVAGTDHLSLHSYGTAIDINPLVNPYVTKNGVFPAGAAPYVDRTQDFPGKIDENDLAYRLFTARGWEWGGAWKSVKDYQHFSKQLN